MAQSSPPRRWEESKEAAVRDIPKYKVFGGSCTDQTDGPELPLLSVGWWEMRGRVKELKIDIFHQWTCANDGYVQVKRSVIHEQGTALAILLLIQLQNLLKEEKMVQFKIIQIMINFLLLVH